MTVSRFLRAPETVAPATGKRIADAMLKTGYVPNRLAGGLAANKTNLIGVMAADLRNPTLAATLQGVFDAVGDQDYQVMVAMGGRTPASEERAVRECLAHRPCAMLIHNTTHSAMTRRMLNNAAIPIVEIGNITRRPIDSVVSYSNFDAIHALTTHLLRRHRAIAFVGLSARYGDRARARRDGYVAAMRESGIEPDPAWIIYAQVHATGAEILAQIARDNPEVDAIIFAGGDLAYEAALERQRRGWHDPQRVAIAAYDGALVRSLPNIVSLRIPRYEIGLKALELVLARLHGEITAPASIELPFELMTD